MIGVIDVGQNHGDRCGHADKNGRAQAGCAAPALTFETKQEPSEKGGNNALQDFRGFHGKKGRKACLPCCWGGFGTQAPRCHAWTRIGTASLACKKGIRWRGSPLGKKGGKNF